MTWAELRTVLEDRGLLEASGLDAAHDVVGGIALDSRRFPTRLVPGSPGTWWEQVRLPRTAAADHLDVFFAPAITGASSTSVINTNVDRTNLSKSAACIDTCVHRVANSLFLRMTIQCTHFCWST